MLVLWPPLVGGDPVGGLTNVPAVDGLCGQSCGHCLTLIENYRVLFKISYRNFVEMDVGAATWICRVC